MKQTRQRLHKTRVILTSNDMYDLVMRPFDLEMARDTSPLVGLEIFTNMK